MSADSNLRFASHAPLSCSARRAGVRLPGAPAQREKGPLDLSQFPIRPTGPPILPKWPRSLCHRRLFVPADRAYSNLWFASTLRIPAPLEVQLRLLRYAVLASLEVRPGLPGRAFATPVPTTHPPDIHDIPGSPYWATIPLNVPNMGNNEFLSFYTSSDIINA